MNIRGGELKINLMKIESIREWLNPTCVTKVRNFIKKHGIWSVSFSSIITPLHVVTIKGMSFHWGKQQHRTFDGLKRSISEASVLAMPNLQQPFEI